MQIPHRNKIILGAVLFILFINFVFIPFINRQKATAIIKTILSDWAQQDAAAALKHFQDPGKSPPIYNLKSYEIKKMIMEKQNRTLVAKFSVILNFSEDNVFPSGKTWLFELERVERNWMVVRYYMTDQ